MMNEERMGMRKIGRKGSMARTWLVMSMEGKREMVEAGRPLIMRWTGLTARDLRVLDPLLSYPSMIVGRERAMVLNLEHIKAIITAHEVLLLNSTDPSVMPFVNHLHSRILYQHLLQEDPYGKDKRGMTKNTIPFEFVVLEACLEEVISSLENEVRDELEHLLDDDGDMAELYLTDKLVQQKFENSSTASSMNNSINGTPNEITLEHEDDENDVDTNRGEISGTQAGSVYSHVTNVEELEMILGAYFVQIGGTLNKLFALREYVEDTEDYIDITLDDTQNRILQTGVKIGTASVVLNMFINVTGIFGMNIHIGLYDYGGMPEFIGVIFGCTAVCIILYVFAMVWYKKKRLLE
ncbi:magnesium transporter MRS2-3-like isoform X2 [Cicer arietinum]|uniref:magnesium transporter MRS2-3-like isoform X2 n=1 Tax=Cicer arietinum TaxID=3827 RepID=UPI003CC67119